LKLKPSRDNIFKVTVYGFPGQRIFFNEQGNIKIGLGGAQKKADIRIDIPVENKGIGLGFTYRSPRINQIFIGRITPIKVVIPKCQFEGSFDKK